MKVLLIGSGGREHSIAWALSRSKSCDEIFSLPGNPGIWKIANKIDIPLKNGSEIAEFCLINNVDLVIIGPEQPLADGLSDMLREKGVTVFGPSKAAARLESSKGFAKDFMIKYNIPTADYRKFHKNDKSNLLEFMKNHPYPLVIKADGLAAGKGVVIANSYDFAKKTIEEMFSGKFKEAGYEVVIEEFLEGEEASVLAICDGKDYITLAPAQDHKRIYDNDEGPNTGGMGSYSPAPIVNDLILERVKNSILTPAIDGMIKEGTPFIGCLYAGLMIKDNQPKVVEFNVRFGDPETQSVLTVLDGDFCKLIYSAASGNIDKSSIYNIARNYSCCVVAASKGYPDNFEKGFEIMGIDDAEKEGTLVFNAGTDLKDGKLITAGGRVLGVTSIADSLKEAIDKAYSAIAKIHFDNIYYRKDIGHRALKNESY